MKLLFSCLLLATTYAGCQQSGRGDHHAPVSAPATPAATPCPPATVFFLHDTVADPQCQALLEAAQAGKDSFAAIMWRAQHDRDSLATVCDTLADRLLLAKLRLRNIQYYTDLVRRNRSQQKFLLGWITRALE